MSFTETEKRNLLGFVQSPPDPRDYAFANLVDVPRATVKLPRSKVPWHAAPFPLYDQVGPSCVGNSRALSATIDQRRDLRRTMVYDGEELYAECKKHDGIPHVEGTFPRIALKIQQDRGVKVKQSRFPKDIGRFDRISVYAAVHTLEEIKVAVHLYGSALLGSTWYDEWFELGKNARMSKGITPMGGHAYTVVGWSDARASLLIQNSWGRQWGTRIGAAFGRGWLPYEYLDWADFEAWRSIDEPQP